MKITLLLALLGANVADAGIYYDNRVHTSSASLRIGYSSVRDSSAVFLSSGAAVVQSTSTTSGHKPFRVRTNAGAEAFGVTQGGDAVVAQDLVLPSGGKIKAGTQPILQTNGTSTILWPQDASGGILIQNAAGVENRFFFRDTGQFGINTILPSTHLDVEGTSQFGTGVTKSTITTAGSITLASNADLTLTGPTAYATFPASVTASAYFGDGANITGIPQLTANQSFSGTNAFTSVAPTGTAAANTQYNANMIKAYLVVNTTGTLSIDDSFNVASVADNGVGDITVSWATDFATANYACTCTLTDTAAGGTSTFCVGLNPAAGSMRFLGVTDAGASADAKRWSIICVGRQ